MIDIFGASHTGIERVLPPP